MWSSLVTSLKDAHEACQEKSRSAAQSGTPVVVIDNTHVQYWEMTPYFQAARANGYRVIIADPKTSWRLNAKWVAFEFDWFKNLRPTYLEKFLSI